MRSRHIGQRLGTALNEVRFKTRSGELVVTRADGGNVMSLPSASSEPFAPHAGFAEALGRCFGGPAPKELFLSAKGGAGAKALIAVWESPEQVKALAPAADLKDVAMQVGAGSVLATAPGGGNPYDMVSRFFAPYYGVPEDPVTGSAHCALTPFWAKRLGKKRLKARQASPRGGIVHVETRDDRVILGGEGVIFAMGEIAIGMVP